MISFTALLLYPPGKQLTVPIGMGGWVGPSAGLDAMEDSIIF
jgi:hypothetical protein